MPAGGARLGKIVAAAGPSLVTLAVLVAVWEACERAKLLPVTVPAPSQIAAAFADSYDALFDNAAPTALSALAGFALAAVIAFALGAVALRFPRAEPAVLRLGVFIDSIPLIALTPILMVWIGNGLSSRIAIGTIAALFPMLVAIVQGFKAIDRSTAELFHVLAASPAQRLTKLAIPTALPYIFAGFKVAAPLAVLGALIAEWVSADQGLGIMMTYAIFSFNAPLAWLCILAVCALALLAYSAVAVAEWLVTGQASQGALRPRAGGNG
jgi:ABC-type nitrate/sulfonate/bicarbonate transport system permease component